MHVDKILNICRPKSLHWLWLDLSHSILLEERNAEVDYKLATHSYQYTSNSLGIYTLLTVYSLYMHARIFQGKCIPSQRYLEVVERIEFLKESSYAELKRKREKEGMESMEA